MSGQSADADVPTCRACYAGTLSKYDRARFWDEPVTGCIYYCPEHQAIEDDLMSRVDWSKVQMASPRHANTTFPPEPVEERA